VLTAREYIRSEGAALPPAHLRSSTRSDGGYDNPHRRPGHFSPQELMPDPAVGQRFYEPDAAEGQLAERLKEIRRARRRD
jgi:replication-associated recombination protein RarA